MLPRDIVRPVIREFIELYKRMPCLWKVQCKEYTDRALKCEAYKILARKLRELEPMANQLTVVKKINNIRTNYRKEKRKIREIEQNGGKFEPTLWYYDLMDFLDTQDDSEIECIDITAVADDDTPSHEEFIDDDPDQDDNSLQPPMERKFDVALLAESSLESVEVPTHRLGPKKRKYGSMPGSRTLGRDQLQNAAKVEDRHDAFGRNIAYKLRTMANDQRIYVEKLINDAIFEGELGNLNRYCCIDLDGNDLQ